MPSPKHLLIHAVLSISILSSPPAFGQSGAEFPKTIDSNGTEVKIEALPKRVIALDLAALDILYALHIDVAGVPSGC